MTPTAGAFSQAFATLVAALVAAVVAISSVTIGVLRDRAAVRRARDARRAAWVGYLTDLWRYVDLNRRDGVIWDMTKIDQRLEYLVPLVFDPENTAGLDPHQIYQIVVAVLDTKLAAHNVSTEYASYEERRIAKQLTPDDPITMRDAAKGFFTGSAVKLELAILALKAKLDLGDPLEHKNTVLDPNNDEGLVPIERIRLSNLIK